MSLFARLRVTRPIRPRSFCLTVIAVALVLFALPYPPLDQGKRLVEIVTSHPKIVVVGASTMNYVSNCDQDQRAIPAMLADMTAQSVLDLSRPGQYVADSVNLAADVASKSSVTDLVVPVAYSHIGEWMTPAYRRLLIYKMAAPGFSVYHASGLADFWNGVTDQPMPFQRGYSFEGRTYPDYQTIAASQFAREHQLASCPEQVTHDPQFTRSYFWWNQVNAVVNDSVFDLLADLGTHLAARGKRMHLVLMPTNLELMATMDPTWPETVQRGQDHVVAELSRRGLVVLDLSKGFGADEFSSQWCACIHLNEKGRLHLAESITRDIRSTLATMPRPDASLKSLASGTSR